jgi:phage terminase large subunit GpA-like protein
MVLEWLDIKANGTPREQLQGFVNLRLAETFEETGIKPRLEVLMTQERDYNIGELPEVADPVFVTVGADVQADRIECEVVAWGDNKESWSIDYRVFLGDTMDLDGEAWTALRSTITDEYHGMRPIFSAVDAGYATDVVYDFCESMPRGSGAYPVMGDDHLAKGRQYIKLYDVEGRKIKRLNVNTDLMKQEIYRYLRMGEREDDDNERLYGACHFPVQYGRRYFEQLTAEQRILKTVSGKQRAMWDAGERRNEALDCRVYNLSMVYAFHEYIRGKAKLEKLSWPDFWILARRHLAKEKAS